LIRRFYFLNKDLVADKSVLHVTLLHSSTGVLD